MLFSRLIEEKMLNLLRQGRVSKWFSGIGQEAISVGVTLALSEGDSLFPMHRNLGLFTARGVGLDRLIAQWQGKPSGFTKGRDRSFHFGVPEHKIYGMISHLGPQLALACGAALAHKLKESSGIAVAFTGEGATSEGDFHEALNLAAVWKLPVIFVIENNGYALSTPTSEQFVGKDLADRGPGYGMKSLIVDGNNVLEVHQAVTKWAKKIRKRPEPLLLECKTFRMRGHEEASGTKYVPQALMDHWQKRDPIHHFEQYLLAEELLTDQKIEALRAELNAGIQDAVTRAFAEQEVQSSIITEQTDVLEPVPDQVEQLALELTTSHEIRYVDAISQGLDQEMEQNERLILMGQDIADYGGVFKVTDGLMAKYGADRVRNTPLCESAIIGAGLGMSLEGYATMIEMQFADFVSTGFNQIVNNLAKLHYRWGHSPNVTIRMPCGGNVGAGPFHSQTNEAWFFHTPGLKIVYPSTAYDAKGLLISSLRDPNPVLFYEHKYLYRSHSGQVPAEAYALPIGKAKVVQPGSDALIITYGLGVSWAMEVTADSELSVEILDLRTLAPLDLDAIARSVKKIGKVLILHEATKIGGVGAELAAFIAEHLFEYLDAPVVRSASLDTPVPFARTLEEQFLPLGRLRQDLARLASY